MAKPLVVRFVAPALVFDSTFAAQGLTNESALEFQLSEGVGWGLAWVGNHRPLKEVLWFELDLKCVFFYMITSNFQQSWGAEVSKKERNYRKK